MDALFMKIADKLKVPGDSDIKGYEEQIELLSFNHGVSAQITGDVSNENRTSGRPNHQDFSVTKFVDKATPKLNQHCCEGANLGKVVITVGRNDKGQIQPLIVYTLSDVVLSSVSVGGGGGGKPSESLSLNYSAIEWVYHVQDQAGSGTKKGSAGNWDLSTNKAA